jgi:hypothetical protein
MGFHHHYVHGPKLMPRLLGGVSTGALTLLGSEADGLSIDFTDASIVVRDTTTTSNAWVSGTNGDVQTFWRDRSFTSYASPSPKITRDSSGNYTYRPHNLVAMSESLLATGAWGATAATLAASGSAAPASGPTSVFSLTEDTANSQHRMNKAATFTVASGSVYTVSVYVKANGRTQVRFVFTSTTTFGRYFNLSNGTTSSSGDTDPTSYGTEDIGNGWYRCYMVCTAGAATGTLQINLYSGGITYVGDGASGVLISGFQANHGPTALTYTKTQAHNLALQSQVLGTSWSVANVTVATNSTTAPDGTATAETITADAVTNVIALYQALTVTSGARYTFSLYVKANGYNYVALSVSGGSEYIQMFNLATGAVATAYGAGTVVSASITNVGSGWYRVSVTGNPDNASSTLNVFLHSSDANPRSGFTGDGASGVYAWGAQLELASSAGKYVATTTAAVYSNFYDLPREWDSSGACQGLLVEEARTNICLYARDIQSGYTKTSATAALTATGVDGVANTASTLTASAANGTAHQRITSASAARSLSMFVKRRTGTGTVSITHGGATTGSDLVTNGAFAADTDWTKGAGWTISGGVAVATGVGAFVVLSQTIGSVTAGKFYRVTVDATISAGSVFAHLAGGSPDTFGLSAGTNSCVIRSGGDSINLMSGGGGFTGTIDNVTVTELAMTDITSSINSSTWTRVSVTNETITNPAVCIKLATSGDAIDVDFCQSEAGAFITSPIYTGSASVTRALDNPIASTQVHPHSQSAGTLYYKASRIGTGTGMRVLVVGGGTSTNESIILDNNPATSGRLTIIDGGVSQAQLTSAGSANGVVEKGAISYAANDIAAVCNGGTVQTDATATLPTVDNISLGAFGGGSPLTGYIAQIMVLPRAMSDAQLQTVTT